MCAYLSNPRNKDNLNNFILEEWCTSMSSILKEAQTLELSDGFENHERVVEIKRGKVQDIPELFST